MLHLISLLRFVRANNGIKSTSYISKFNSSYMRNLFLFAFGLSFSRQVFGDAIICHRQDEKIANDLLQTTCLINGTFTRQIIEDSSGKRIYAFYHSYYQWISLMFLMEAFMFYIPYHLWARWCEPDIKGLVVDKPERVKTVLLEIEKNGHGLFYKNWLLEIFYTIHIIFQASLLYKFFNLNEAILPAHFKSWWDLQGIIDLLFPNSGNCFFDFYSGGAQTTGKFYCLLPLNVLYRKIFYMGYILFWILFLLQICIISLRNLQVIFPVTRIPDNRFSKTNVNKWWAYQLALTNTEGENLWLLQRTIFPICQKYLLTTDV